MRDWSNTEKIPEAAPVTGYKSVHGYKSISGDENVFFRKLFQYSADATGSLHTEGC